MKDTTASILNAHQLYKSLKATPFSDDIYTRSSQTGRGAHKRFHHFVPNTGEDAVRQSATKSANTLKGIKAMHQIQSTGEEGLVMTRSRCCHRCLGCRDQPTSRECIHNALCGEQQQVELSLKTAPSPALSSRGALSAAGIAVA